MGVVTSYTAAKIKALTDGAFVSVNVDSEGNLHLIKLDGTDINAGVVGGGGFYYQDAKPTGPAVKPGAGWFNTRNGKTYILVNDGNSTQWVEVGAGVYNDASLVARMLALESRTQNAIVQVVQTVLDTATSFAGGASNSVFLDIAGLAATITPKFATSKIMVSMSVSGGATGDGLLRLMRGSTPIGIPAVNGTKALGTAFFGMGFDRPAGGVGVYEGVTSSIDYLDSPATTSTVTYKAQASTSSAGQTIYINRTKNDAASEERVISTITLMEVAQ